MIVVDASAVAELVLETETGGAVARRLGDEHSHAPAHFEVEVAGVIRRAVLRGLLPERDGLIALDDLLRLPVERWPLHGLMSRAYSLRATHSVADAVYVALAEGLNCPLVTSDRRLARSHGHTADIEYVG